jgi:hypothetical protein
MQYSPRKRHLISPRLQLRSAVVFLGMASIYILLQAFLLWRAMARSGEADSLLFANELVSILRLNLIVTIAVLIPVTLIVSTYMTHKVAGPIYRFEVFLERILRGEQPGPCKIRKGDELQYLCEILNAATAPLREPAPALPTGSDAERPTAASLQPHESLEGT